MNANEQEEKFFLPYDGRQGCVTIASLPTFTRNVPSISNVLSGFWFTSSIPAFTIFLASEINWTRTHTSKTCLNRCMSLFFRRTEKAVNRWFCQKHQSKTMYESALQLEVFFGCECECQSQTLQTRKFSNMLEGRSRILIQLYSCDGGTSCSKYYS